MAEHTAVVRASARNSSRCSSSTRGVAGSSPAAGTYRNI